MERRDITADLFYREDSPDRKLLSANDWYGYGCLVGAGIIAAPVKVACRWYCTKNGAYEQYNLGYMHAHNALIDAQRLKRKLNRVGRAGS